jgi:hypothetical protein
MRKKTFKLWTQEENEIGRRLFEEDASEAEFLERLGRTKEVAGKHFYYVNHRAKVLQRRGEAPLHCGPTANAPSKAIMNGVQRQSAAPRSLASELFGDPQPGRSALDRK